MPRWGRSRNIRPIARRRAESVPGSSRSLSRSSGPIGGGGFDTFQREAYAQYAPDERDLDPHSIWFQVLAEHGFVGLGLFLLLWLATWRTGAQIIALCRERKDLTWARDLAAMIQAALIGFWVGGSFLGLAYWDYPYILIAILVLTKGVVQRRLAEASVPVDSGPTVDRLGLPTRA